MGERVDSGGPLFETRAGKGRVAFRFYAGSVFTGVVLIWIYRVLQIINSGDGGGKERWVLLGLLAAEIWFGIYWVLTLSVRWNPVYRHTFKERLSGRYEDRLPRVDVYVCTADPKLEPPSLVVSTVLSVMAFDYPQEKLAVYLSDDGGSELTFYALWEASRFAKFWIPFCKKFKVTARSPSAYFSGGFDEEHGSDEEWLTAQKLYKEMENKIDTAVKLGKVPEEVRKQHKGFSEWNSAITPRDHQAIVQILIDGRNPDALDIEGSALPTLVYVAREKRPQHFHNFKAGAMNALIRVSSEISNGRIILNLDCDMYSNNPELVRDALCFFMDEEKGNEIGFVQLPQRMTNITKNDLYGNSLKIHSDVEFPGLDGYGGPLYIGSGCFHRRHSLLGNRYTNDYREEWETSKERNLEENTSTLEERAVKLASCSFETNTQWGKEVGLKYGCPVEDVITGLTIQCKGWKSIFFNPQPTAFFGIAPITLPQTLVQQKRWSEGDFQIFVSKYNPFLYGHRRIKLGLKMGYSIYCLWAPNCFPVLFYVIIPSLCLLNSVPMFPSVSNVWFVPFACVILSTNIYGLWEMLAAGCTIKGWWNEHRMWLFKRTTSYLFASIDIVLKLMGLNKSAFVITSKVADDDISERYEKEIMEFGEDSQMFTILSTLAFLNLFCLIGGVFKAAVSNGKQAFEELFLQLLLCGVLVAINIPVYIGMFFRTDSGRMPSSVVLKGVALAGGACLASIAVAEAS